MKQKESRGKKIRLDRRFFSVTLALIGLIGVILIVYTTHWGSGLMDDSFIYITSARNLAAGRGLAWPWGDGTLRPMTYFPPLFPLILAAAELLKIDALIAARWINALAFGGSLVIIGLIARRAARSWAFAILAALLVLTSDVLVEVYSWAMSEAVYIFLALAGLLVLGIFFERGRRAWLAAAALLFGLGFLTRYIGFSLVLVGLTALLFLKRRGALHVSWRQRLAEAILLAAISLLPMALWMVRNLLVIGGAIDRTADQYLVTLNQLSKGAGTLLAWFIPGRFVQGREFFLIGLVFLAAIMATYISLRLLSRQAASQASAEEVRVALVLRGLLTLQVIFHLLVLWVSKSFFEPTTPLNDRILSPILPALLLLTASFLADFWQSQRRGLQAISIAGMLALVALFALRSVELVPRLHEVGLGFARRGWHRSETIEAVQTLPQVPLFSNSPAAVYMYTGRPAYPIYDLNLMREQMLQKDAALVLFKSVSVALYDVTEEQLTQGLYQVEDFQDGAIYQISP